MNDPISPSACPDCGAPLSGEKLCPVCLMRQALISRTVLPDRENGFNSPPLAPEEIASHFPQFEILGCLGRGGMGVVYKARQKSLNRLVAIKILAPERGQESRFAERFAREAELLAQLNHPHIVTIHDFGETGGLFYLVMEFVDGVNLRDLLRDGKLAPQQALAIVPPICEALQFAHGKGIVHRDIKPENLLLDRDGRIKIADFGIAALIGAESDSAGTPPYMAPEQQDGKTAEVDHRADIYALGVVLYEMLTGERPAKDLVAPSKKAPLAAGIDEMVLRALEKSPDRRYQSAEEFRTVVETITENKTPPGVPISPPPVPPPPKPKGMLRRYWWLFLVMIPVSIVLGMGAGAIWNSVAPERYESHATLFFLMPSTESEDRVLQSPSDALLTPPFLKNIADQLRLNDRWGTFDASEQLREMVTVKRRRGTRLLDCMAESSNAREAAGIANAVALALVDGHEKRVISSEATPPASPVTPNKPLNLFIFSVAGLLLSPWIALMLMKWLNHHRDKEKAVLAISIAAGITSGLFCVIVAIITFFDHRTLATVSRLLLR